MIEEATQVTLPSQLFADWLNPSAGRSRPHSSVLLQQYESHRQEIKSPVWGEKLMGQLGKAFDRKVEEEFQRLFVFGVPMRIWRKGRLKQAEVFLDPFLPSLLWISSQTKAFLFDLTYTIVERFDGELQRASGQRYYLVLHYFEESLPFIFGDAGQMELWGQLFSSYILHNSCHQRYPPYFSRIVKLYTAEEARDSRARQRSAADVLKVSRLIGLTQYDFNWQVLQAVAGKTQPIQLTDSTCIDHQQIGEYFKILHCVEPIRAVFERYAGTTMNSYLQYLFPLLSRQCFKQFLIFQQGEDEATIAEILQQTRPLISFYDFCEYLLSQKSNYICLPPPVEEGLPLTDYFCYSSHNTYLSGNQLTSDSKVERFLEDLQRGVKCVQADVHNDGNRPIITHALNDKSFCKPIDFEETIHAILRFCQHHPAHYPIILSLENHATDANRYKMLNILYHSFGSRLFLLSAEDHSLSYKTLAQLRGKVIIKTDSKLHQLLPFRKQLHTSSPIKCNNYQFTLPQIPLPQFKNEIFRGRYDKFLALVKQSEGRKEAFVNGNPKELYLPMAEMTKITGIFKSPTGVNNPQSTGYECTSLTNEKALKQEEELLITYTQRSWLRIYPLGTEISSSNFDPVPFLEIGAQLIALNTQTRDSYAWLMMSYFTAGRPLIPALLGYIPKPLRLRSPLSSPQSQRTYRIRTCTTCERVTVKFYGTKRDMKANKEGGQEGELVFCVRDYQMGFLMFTINEKLRECVPLRWARQGYRVLIAKNQMYRDSGIRVLVSIIIKDETKQ